MRKLLVFQHSAREPLGVLDPMLRRSGFRVRYINFSRDPLQQPDVSRYNGLVVLGGPMNVDQVDRYPHLATEIAAIQEALRLDIPILGICLGAQLLAAALGANVRPNNVREIGWYRLHPTAAAQSDRLCRHFDGSQHVFQWHAYTFDLPPGAVHLASTRPAPTRRSVSANAPTACSSTWKRTSTSSSAGCTCPSTVPKPKPPAPNITSITSSGTRTATRRTRCT
jgi:GMP synthase (glutamine-hydrolysing)